MSTLYQMQGAWMQEALAPFRRQRNRRAGKGSVHDGYRKAAGRAYAVAKTLARIDADAWADSGQEFGTSHCFN